MICALRVFLGLTLITGVAYPLLVTGLSSVLAPHTRKGSLIYRGDALIGSALIGQEFTSDRYFWSRPSGTSPTPYNGAASAGRNMAVTNPELLKRIATESSRIISAHGGRTPVPVDLVTASGSGLDPHISPAAADYQAERVARARGSPLETIRNFISAATEQPTLGLLGQQRVNVLRLNLALDQGIDRSDTVVVPSLQ